jgi:hypothetical protein
MLRRIYLQAIAVLFIFVVSTSGCGSMTVSYRPPFLPVKLAVDSQGNVSVVGEVSLVTFIGEFSIGAEYVLKSAPETVTVIIRNRGKGQWGTDTIYRVRTGRDKFVAVINGRTLVQIENNQVLIDITDAKVESIEFKRIDAPSPEANYEKDIIPVTAIKTPVVAYLLLFAIILTLLTGLIDLILLLFGLYFPLTIALWQFVEYVTIDWYWNRATWIGFIVGAIVFLLTWEILRLILD